MAFKIPTNTNDPILNYSFMDQTQMPPTLTKQLALQRHRQIKPHPQYHLKLRLKMGCWYEGHLTCHFCLTESTSDILIDYKGKEVKKVCMNEAEVPFEWNGVFIRIGKEHVKESNVVEIQFENEYSNDGHGLHAFYGPDQQYLYNQSEPWYANQIFPCFDQPDIKAIFEVEVTAPQEWVVVANEPVLEKRLLEESKEQVHRFKKTPLLPTYLLAIAAGDYLEYKFTQNYRDIPMSVFCRKNLKKEMEESLAFFQEVTIKSMKFFEEFFDIPFQFTKYDSVFCSEYKMGAMEHPGCVTFTDRYLRNKEYHFLVTTIAHEMAHMWVGNYVTLKWWDQIWLNESIVKCLEYVCLEKERIESATLPDVRISKNRRKETGYAGDKGRKSYPICFELEDAGKAQERFGAVVYGKGGGVVRQLVFRMGEGRFRDGMRKYLKKHAWGNVSTGDFVEAMKGEAEFDLARWMDEWMFTRNHNCLRGELVGETRLRVSQYSVTKHSPTVRSHLVRVALFDEHGQLTTRDLLLEKDSQDFDVPRSRAFFLNYDDHAFVQVETDAASLHTLKRGWAGFDSPFKKLILNSLHFMVSKRALPMDAYFDFVSTVLPDEHEFFDAEIPFVTSYLYYNANTAKQAQYGFQMWKVFDHKDVYQYRIALYQLCWSKHLVELYFKRMQDEVPLHQKKEVLFYIIHLIHEQHFDDHFRHQQLQVYEDLEMNLSVLADLKTHCKLKSDPAKREQFFQEVVLAKAFPQVKLFATSYLNKRSGHQDMAQFRNFFDNLLPMYEQGFGDEYFDTLVPDMEDLDMLIAELLMAAEKGAEHSSLVGRVQKKVKKLHKLQKIRSL